ncbi:MAG: ABC transporter ATP-binding protein [Clostridiales bacterium]|jgi:peptide/nickel transport system ATP-binding protein/oligopeptide transport system ATP-binding protein|nr:ABC transporter ATP-binding protein [Clostridiales bacterium]
MTNEPILQIKDLSVNFYIKNKLFAKPDVLSAVSGVSLSVNRGESYGLVGESGCGKTTLARAVLRLQNIERGDIFFNGRSITGLKGTKLKAVRRSMQMIFQDPFSSLNPRLEVWRLICEPLIISGARDNAAVKKRASELLEMVGLSDSDLYRHASDFSGGQRQRLVIARAIALNPEFVICDEPVSALDVSVHAQIINLLKNLQRELKLTYLFITHNLTLVKYFTDNMSVMYLGNIVEQGATAEIFKRPKHPYTKALTGAILTVGGSFDDGRELLQGDVTSPVNPPPGCRFFPRCRFACDKCREISPTLSGPPDHRFACWNP